MQLRSSYTIAGFGFTARLHIGIFGAVAMIFRIDPGHLLMKNFAFRPVVGPPLAKPFFAEAMPMEMAYAIVEKAKGENQVGVWIGVARVFVKETVVLPAADQVTRNVMRGGAECQRGKYKNENLSHRRQ